LNRIREQFKIQCMTRPCLSIAFNKELGCCNVSELFVWQSITTMITTPGFGNHVTVTNLSGEAASPLFKVVNNPNPAK
jgi:hypothetical protein